MNARTMMSAAAVVAASVLSWGAARGTRKPFSVDAPAYRRVGPETAKVSIVEFSDFECPACRFAEAPLRGILKLHEGKVRLTFKHNPLDFHRSARAAAIAAECSGRQGKFWDYHHALYDHQQDWVEAAEKGEAAREKLFESYAREAKLDLDAWRACRKDPEAAAIVAADQKDGDHAWVAATPTFFVNGKRFVGGQDLGQRGLRHIEKELAK